MPTANLLKTFIQTKVELAQKSISAADIAKVVSQFQASHKVIPVLDIPKAFLDFQSAHPEIQLTGVAHHVFPGFIHG